MKAIEFIKKFGWGKAKEVSSFTSNVCEDPTHFDSDLDIYVHFDDFKGVMDESDVCIHDIKRLVEAYELVETYTSRFNSDAEWFFVSEYCKKNRISPFFSENYNKASRIYKQATQLVEEVNNA